MALAAAVRRGMQAQLWAGVLESQLRSLSSSTLTQHSAAAAAAEATSAAASPAGERVPAGRTVKMNLCTAVNDALHIAMEEDPKCVGAGLQAPACSCISTLFHQTLEDCDRRGRLSAVSSLSA